MNATTKTKNMKAELLSSATPIDVLKPDFQLVTHVLGTYKGGTGKTGLGCTLAETALMKAERAYVLDTDVKNESQITNTYRGAYVAYTDENGDMDSDGRARVFRTLSTHLDLCIPAHRDAAIERYMAKNPEITREQAEAKVRPVRHLIIDLGAAQLQRFMDMIRKDLILDRMLEEGHLLNIYLPVDGSRDAMAQFGSIADDLKPDGVYGPYAAMIETHVVLNAAMGKNRTKAASARVAEVDLERDFPLYVNSWGFQELRMPTLESDTAWAAWERARSEAIANGDKSLGMDAWARAQLGDDVRRDQLQMSKWLNRVVPRLHAVMNRTMNRTS